MLTRILVKLISANFIAWFSKRNLASGMDEIASNPTIKANHITNMLSLGYFNQSAIGCEKTKEDVMNRAEVATKA